MKAHQLFSDPECAGETRAGRAERASAHARREFTDRQQSFVSPLLKLRYNNAIADAVTDLGNPEQIRRVFVGFQRHLYQS